MPVHPATIAQLQRDKAAPRLFDLPALGRPETAHPVIHHTTTPDKPITRQRLAQIVSEIGRHIGVHMWPHMLRHTYACESLRLGLSIYDVMHLLGHRSLNTTVVYLHVQPDELADRVRHARDAQLAATMRLALEAPR